MPSITGNIPQKNIADQLSVKDIADKQTLAHKNGAPDEKSHYYNAKAQKIKGLEGSGKITWKKRSEEEIKQLQSTNNKLAQYTQTGKLAKPPSEPVILDLRI